MKKKFYFSFIVLLFMLAIGAVRYDVSQKKVYATENVTVNELEKNDVDFTKSETPNNDLKSNVGNELENSSKSTTDKKLEDKNIVSEGQEINSQVKKIKSENSKESIPNTKENPTDTIKIGNDIYENIMDNDKFQDLISIANKYDSILYAIPNSDCFAIAKQGSPIFFMSPGVASSPVKNAKILTEWFKIERFNQLKGITENINFVLNTGAKVSVEFTPYLGYTIEKENETIKVNYADF